MKSELILMDLSDEAASKLPLSFRKIYIKDLSDARGITAQWSYCAEYGSRWSMSRAFDKPISKIVVD